MGNPIVIVDELNLDGVRTLHLMANDPLSAIEAGYEVPPGAEVKVWTDEVRMQHLMATWPAREAMFLDGKEMVVWALESGGSISQAATEAALLFFADFEFWPSAAWVRNWPRGLDVEKARIPISDECWMDLFAVPWAYERCVLVGGNFYKLGNSVVRSVVDG